MKHNFKKILSIFLVALMCLSVFPVSIFAEDAHTHDYVCPECLEDDQVKVVSEQVDPTCEKAAGVWYRCDNIDGHQKSNTPHEFFVQTAVAHHSNPELFKHTAAEDKTCKDDGNYEFWHCDVCNKNYYKDADGAYVAYADGAHIIPADGKEHSWGDWKENGFICGVSDGEKVRTCGLCGETETVVLTKTEHLWVVDGYKVNGELVKVEDYEPTCLETVTVVVHCGNDGCNVKEEKTGKGWGHTLTHHDAVGATCTENGNVEYWSCSLCGNNYGVANPTFETAALETVVTLAGHGLTNGKDTHTGVCVGTYYECLDCNKFFADEALTDELTADELKAHNEHDLDKVEAKEPTCADFGWIEHHFCDKCDRYYADENAARELDYETQVKLAKTNHISKGTVDADPADCDNAGTIAYKECKFCNGKFAATDADDNLVNVVTDTKQNITVPDLDENNNPIYRPATPEEYEELGGHQHKWKLFQLVEPDCLLWGRALWICEACDDFTQPGTEYNEMIEPIAHANATVVEQLPTCTVAGTYKYYSCPDCTNCFGTQRDGSLDPSNVLTQKDLTERYIDKWEDATAHPVASVTWYTLTEATCARDGWKAHGVCSACNAYFYATRVETEVEGVTVVEYTDVVNTTAADVVLPKHTQETISAVAPESCKVHGYTAYVKCSCGKFYATTDTTFADPKDSKEAFKATIGHDFKHVEATVTCKDSGVIEHWICQYEDCGEYYVKDADGNITVLTNAEAVKMTWKEYIESFEKPEEAHSWITGVAATPCTGTDNLGTAGYDICSVCGTTRPVSQHTFETIVWKTEPTCDDDGIYYLACVRCAVIKTDANGTRIEYVETDHKDHYEMGTTHHMKVDYTCYNNGTIEYWECNHCHGRFNNASCLGDALTDEQITIAWQHTNVVDIESGLADLDECGGTYNLAQKHCEACGDYWLASDSTNVQKTPFTAVKVHLVDFTYDAGWAATCKKGGEGQKETWTCSACGKSYLDANGETLVENGNEVIARIVHTFTFVPYKAPTCMEGGHKAYYYVDNCTIFDCGEAKYRSKDAYATAEADTKMLQSLYNVSNRVEIEACAHSVTFVPAVPAVCVGINQTENGNVAYYTCVWCELNFAETDAVVDEDGNATVELGVNALATVVTTHTPNYNFDATRGSNFDPTCTEHGYEFLICTCDFVYYQLKSAKGHYVTEWNETTETDCQKDGLLVYYYCASCDKSYAEPDCLTEVKNGDKVIRNDADALIREAGKHYVVDADGKIVYIEDDCTKEVNYSACAGCGDKLTITHVWVDGENEANCLYPESTFKICNDCHVVDESTRKSFGEKDPDAHVYAWEIDVEATCHSVGSKHQYCQICGDHFDKTLTEEIPTVGHTVEVWISTPATCLTPGQVTIDCMNCDFVEYHEIPTTGHHTMTEWELNPAYDAPNYTVADAQLRFCSVCKGEDTYEYRAMPDVHFSVSLDNGVVAGAELVNSGKLAVTINMSAYKKEANALQLSFKYSSNLTFDSIVWGEGATAFGYNQGNGVNGVCTLFSMLMVPSDVVINGEDLVYATVYFTIDGAVPTADSKVLISDLTVLEMVEIVLEDDDVDANVLTTVGGNVEDGYVTLGDVNNDGEIGLKDIQLMYPALTGEAEYDAQADFDKDGAVTAADFAALQKFFATVYNYEQLINPELRPA